MLPVVQLLAQLHDPLAVLRVQVLRPELQGLETLLPFRGNTADVAKPVVQHDGEGVQIDLVEREAGEVRTGQEASLAPAQRLVGSPSSECVAKDLADQPQPVHQALGPPALRPQGIEGQGAHGRLASHREREGQVRPDPGQAAASPSTAASAGSSSREDRAIVRPAFICCTDQG